MDAEYEELIRNSVNESLAILSAYKPFQRKKAKELTETIVSLERKTPDRLHAAIIFVCLRLFDSKVEDKALPIPVIRVLREPNDEEADGDDLFWFVDVDGRAYKTWEVCYPQNTTLIGYANLRGVLELFIIE